jgi:hypothetical protein
MVRRNFLAATRERKSFVAAPHARYRGFVTQEMPMDPRTAIALGAAIGAALTALWRALRAATARAF